MCCVDDVLMGSPVKLGHVESIKCVLNALKEHGWTVNADKGQWL